MNKKLYYILLVLSLILFIGTIIFLNNTKFVAPIFLVISIYLFFGSIIKLCNTNKKLKNIMIHVIDLLFWLP